MVQVCRMYALRFRVVQVFTSVKVEGQNMLFEYDPTLQIIQMKKIVATILIVYGLIKLILN